VDVARGASVLLGPGVVLGAESRITALGGAVVMRRGARLGERAIVVSRGGVEIGERAVIGDWAAVVDVVPMYADVETPVRVQPVRAQRVAVGPAAVIGPHAAVYTDVRAGTVVDPYAVV
jgi:UDP-3-O-[3-hydroxymyristoyl] glucosamine N-acyltransferase